VSCGRGSLKLQRLVTGPEDRKGIHLKWQSEEKASPDEISLDREGTKRGGGHEGMAGEK